MKNSKGLKALVYGVVYPIATVEIAFLITAIASQFAGRSLITNSPIWQSSWNLCIFNFLFAYVIASSNASLYFLINDKKIPLVFRPFFIKDSRIKQAANSKRFIIAQIYLTVTALAELFLTLSRCAKAGSGFNVAGALLLAGSGLAIWVTDFRSRHKKKDI